MRNEYFVNGKNRAIFQYDNGTKYYCNENLRNNTAVELIYGYTNENIRSYINLLNIAGENVATVGSSLDQAFYSVFKDASEVTVMDGNPFTLPIGELKRSCILNMDYDEFLNYWTPSNILYPYTLKKLTSNVSPESKEFFDYVLSRMENRDPDLARRCIVDFSSFYRFTSDGRFRSFRECCEFYDNPESYNLLKKKLANTNINIKIAEFSQFPKILEGEYGSILVSNIFDYYNNKNSYFAVVEDLVEKRLKDGGTMQMYYGFSNSPRYNKELIQICPKLKPDIYKICESSFGVCGYDKEYCEKLDSEPKDLKIYEKSVYIYEK